MMWRPDNWHNPYDQHQPLAINPQRVYETGADAMLEVVAHELNQAQNEKELRVKMDALVKSVLASKMFKEAKDGRKRR